MSTLEIVAVLEDNEPLSREVTEKLSAIGIECRTFDSRNGFKLSLERGDPYDAVILDWFFEDPESSVVARLVLEDMRSRLFAPVLVYTEQKNVVEAELPALPAPFNRIRFYDKETTNPARLAEELTKWYAASMGARLADGWRGARRHALEESLYELDALEGEDFHRTLRHVLVMDTGPVPDVDHALEFLERYVMRKVSGNPDFRKSLEAELREAQEQNIRAKGQQETALVNAHRYMFPTDSVVRNGDVIEILDEEARGVGIAVVLTPACDLDQRKCFELRLVLAEERNPGPGTYSDWPLVGIRTVPDGPYRNFVLDFHRTFFIRDASIGQRNDERAGRMIAYDHGFQDLYGRKLTIKRICRLDDPYRSDLLQRFSAHASRIGIP